MFAKLMLCLTVCLMMVSPACGENTSEDIIAWAHENEKKLCFRAVSCPVQLPSFEDIACLQGGGTDGKSAYYAMIDGKWFSKSIIYKYDLETWELTACSEVLRTNHSNDITYDEKEDRILIASCNPLSEKYFIIDPETLTLLDNTNLLYSFDRFDLFNDSQCLVLGKGYQITVFDLIQNKPLAWFESQGSRYTTQGICCDGTYIYDIRFADIDENYIVIHDLNGTYYGEIPLLGMQGEAENIFRLSDGRFAVGFNKTNCVYIAELGILEE